MPPFLSFVELEVIVKVVIFCGGAGMRLRGYVDDVPKPMVQIGSRPLLWHLMKYYAHYGHKDFILCLGYKGNVIKDYFLNYEETVSNDFVWSKGGKKIDMVNRDIDDSACQLYVQQLPERKE